MNRKYLKLSIFIGLVPLALIGIYFCYYTSIGILYGLLGIVDTLQWKDHTTPLQADVIADICEKFDLPEDDPRCQPDATVYAPDFFGVISETFQPSNGDWATYDEVEEKLGEYRLRRGGPTSTTSDGVEYFTCWYDLQGDQAYPIIIWFYGDGSMWKMSANVGD